MKSIDGIQSKATDKEKTPRPNLLDVAKVDGRWVQVGGGGNLIVYLDDGKVDQINWNDFVLKKDWGGRAVKYIKEAANISVEEISQIHWGPEEEEHPYLKEQVRVFGEFEKRK